MSRVRSILLWTGCAASLFAAYGADQGATALLPADSVSVFRLSDSAGEFARMSPSEVKGQPFSKALRIDVLKKPQRAQIVQIATPVDAAMASGDVLSVSFWMRSGNTGEATVDAGFRVVPQAGAGGRAGAPGAPGAAGRGRGMFAQPSLNAASAGSAWKKIQFPFALTRAYNKGEAEVYFTLGLREQSVEIAGIELMNYGTSKKVADLPFTKLGYAGSEPGAAWRKAAEARIEKIRKADLSVVVKDKAGKLVRGAEVSVRMRKHAFLFGTAVSGSALSSQRLSADDLAKYKQETLKLFSFSVMENENKWPQWANKASRPATLAAIDWLRGSGVQVRGHNLVWPSWNNTNVKTAQDALVKRLGRFAAFGKELEITE